MKKIFFSILSLFVTMGLFAQQLPPLPVDDAVRIGHLENGLTYYIRHNAEPEGQANFYIAQKVGSILEEEDQRGLAHFLEHMCFNGSEHFPGNGIIRYCESIGVKFGGDINAYTSIDETVYNIDNVPVAKFPTAVDSCLLILYDWAGALLLEDEEIDKERGVIHEEWRRSQNAMMRMYEKILPEVYQGNKYGERLPIGTMEVVDNFPYEALRAYYKRWYRPDQQAIIVVGDVDVEQVEGKIKALYGTLPAAPADAPKRYYPQIEPNAEPIVSIATDSEQSAPVSYIFIKHPAVEPAEKANLGYLLYEYAVSVLSEVSSERLEEMAQKSNPDFIQAGIEDGDFFLSKTEGAYTGIVVSDETQVLRALTSLYREMLRLQRNGVTSSEYDRARENILTSAETAAKQVSKKTSGQYCREYVRNFVDGDPIMGDETEFALLSQIAPNISVEAVNQLLSSILEENDGLVVTCMLPDKEGASYPSGEEVKTALKAVENETIPQWVDETSDEPLVGKTPKAGKVKKTEEAAFGYTLLTLKNGAKVYFRQTDFNPDEVLFSANSLGGKSLYDDSEIVTLSVEDELLDLGGLGNFSSTALSKALSGKNVRLNARVGEYSESLSGKSSPKDFETLLQLNYLYFTSLRSDSEAFESWKTRTAAALVNQEADPMSAFSDSLTLIYENPARAYSLKSADIDKVDYERALEIARERFSNAADFTFYITGAIDLETAMPLIETWIGSLKGNKRKTETFRLDGLEFKKGTTDVRFERQMGTPMATDLLVYSAYPEYNLHEDVALDAAFQTLTMELLAEIREKTGLTYSIGAYGAMSDFPQGNAYMQIVYQTGPDKLDAAQGKVDEILARYIAEGPSQEDLDKAKEYLVKNWKAAQTQNGTFENALRIYLRTGVDTNTDYEAVVNSLTVEDLRDALSRLLAPAYRASIVMVGVE